MRAPGCAAARTAAAVRCPARLAGGIRWVRFAAGSRANDTPERRLHVDVTSMKRVLRATSARRMLAACEDHHSATLPSA